jgi:hypothetical protein
MATTTTNIGLTKPATSESASILVINDNMDTIDTKMGAVGNTSLQSQVTTLDGKVTPKGTANLNTATEAGKYYYASGTTNSPNANYSGSVNVIPASSDIIYQFAIDTTSNAYTRVYKNSAWTSWNQLALDSKVNNRMTRYINTSINSDGAQVMNSIAGWLEKKEFMFLLEEIGTSKFLFAHVTYDYVNRNSTPTKVTIASKDLSFGATNNQGTQVISGCTSGASGTLRWTAW